ncbi:hypothetical protein T440DRAFT_386189 [Plenodomus tracheiphilus IPT5]|uniref:Extracelular serine carboxypeptidase-like protein n=1 Tax=Plenodomus tracheiphilus IPT5 TaxID=1408161 RepID=A0A6A7BMH7_9PLEO|nr:hypothetical protein T440DRAFT_386189 [Plenodomus tracheiphilus IPT5]
MKFASILCSIVAIAAAARIKRAEEAAPAYKAHSIDQPIDHFPSSDRYLPHTNDTFKQRYFFDSSYYKPGGPVFLYIGGETSGESRFSNLQTGLIQILMQKFSGLGVILENRYYGESYPYNTSSTDELRFLTTEQTIADNAYFRQHATFPGVNSTLSGPDVPWIMYGGSLAGAQTAFTMKTYNSLFAGGIGSSATTQTLRDYPQWYNPIMKYGPSDCISRIINIVDKMDALIQANNTAAIQHLKSVFGLGDLTDLRDFAMTIAFPIGGPMNYPTNTWQELNWSDRYGSPDFWNFCSNVTNPHPPENISSIDTQLSHYTNGSPWTGLGGYSSYVKTTLLPLCTSGRIDSTDPGCFSTQNVTFYALTANSASRSYLYSTCLESGGYQTAPLHGPSLISRVLTHSYTQQWCTWAFPPGSSNAIPAEPILEYYNVYGGWNIAAPNLALIDGSTDVWLDLCSHSELVAQFGKGMQGIRVSSEVDPRYLIAGAGHHWDSYGIGDVQAEPAFIREAHEWEIRVVEGFLGRWTGR